MRTKSLSDRMYDPTHEAINSSFGRAASNSVNSHIYNYVYWCVQMGIQWRVFWPVIDIVNNRIHSKS